ncbi:hypothetical protein FXN63_12465 [Pigmentiphaga aceris]|uniref:Uncharacterized protein n=1 Tax=Pigmentiphaga aceris TaxID=1940612 RepID=A0A5C0B3S3_9BURK|nr:hypothetical protein FXN63_12465 [Pigmentiphaga aceris]
MRRVYVAAALFSLSAALPVLAQPAALDNGIADIQREWSIIQYQAPEKTREDRFAVLSTKAQALADQFPQRAEPHIWAGIALSSWAGAKGGLGALGLAKQAREQYEQAIAIDPKALQGSAQNSLGVLYFKVPGWPIGFGDDNKAEALLKEALAINPDGIDPNYFYADYLVQKNRKADAAVYLERALKAPPRLGREIADAGRREDIAKLQQKLP